MIFGVIFVLLLNIIIILIPTAICIFIKKTVEKSNTEYIYLGKFQNYEDNLSMEHLKLTNSIKENKE